MQTLSRFGQGLGFKWLVFVLCGWVLVQMFGMPNNLFSLTTSTDLFTESTCQEFSVLPSAPEPRTPTRSTIPTHVQPAQHLFVFVTSVFHPPQA